MKLLRIDHLAPQGASIQLHPQLTVLRGATPEMRRKLIELFQAFSSPESLDCSGMIEVGGVQLALDQLTLQGLQLDPFVNAVLQWSPTPQSEPAPQSEPSPQSEPTPQPVFAGSDRSSVVAGIQQRVDAHREELQQVIAALSALADSMEQVRSGLDAEAASELGLCRIQIDELEARRAVLRAEFEWERQRLDARREELHAEVSVLSEKLDMVASLDLHEVCAARDELKGLLTASLVPDPVAQELAVRIYNSLRNLREITDRAVAATSRRVEAEQNLDAAQVDLVASTSASLSPLPNADDLERLEQLRTEIFSYPTTMSTFDLQPPVTLQELRAEESQVLKRLGYESYSDYVRGIPLVKTDLERSARRESAMRRVQQFQQELQQLILESPDPQDLELAEMELSVMLQSASELLATDSIDPSSEVPAEPMSATATDAQRAENVRAVVTLLRERKVAAAVIDTAEVHLVAERLRVAVERAAGPVLNETWLDSQAWTGTGEDLLRVVDLWLAVFQDPADWVASTRSQMQDLRAQIVVTEAEEPQPNDVSQWAQVEAELDAVMDRMVDAQSRAALHDQSMTNLADLRDKELQVRGQERELLGALAEAQAQLHEAQLQEAQLHAAQLHEAQLHAAQLKNLQAQEVRAQPQLPPRYRAGSPVDAERSLADDCEWTLIERVAQQRAVSFLGSVPLLIDALPSDPLAQHQVIQRVQEMSAVVQLVILSDHEWLFEQAQSGRFPALAIQF